jgi:hypothetical protein
MVAAISIVPQDFNFFFVIDPFGIDAGNDTNKVFSAVDPVRRLYQITDFHISPYLIYYIIPEKQGRVNRIVVKKMS